MQNIFTIFDVQKKISHLRYALFKMRNIYKTVIFRMVL